MPGSSHDSRSPSRPSFLPCIHPSFQPRSLLLTVSDPTPSASWDELAEWTGWNGGGGRTRCWFRVQASGTLAGHRPHLRCPLRAPGQTGSSGSRPACVSQSTGVTLKIQYQMGFWDVSGVTVTGPVDSSVLIFLVQM